MSDDRHAEHNAVVDEINEQEGERKVDPVSGRTIPRGVVIKKDPNRTERRRLARWRRTGRT